MSKIDALIKKLELKKKKIEFLTHILVSAKEYHHKPFAEVKEEVVALLGNFTEAAIKSIEDDSELSVGARKQQVQSTEQNTPFEKPKEPTPQEQEAQKRAQEVDPNFKMQFAMENRKLAGKTVQVINDEKLDITGEVVGLDAPNVVVKTKSGHNIKVPIERINVI